MHEKGDSILKNIDRNILKKYESGAPISDADFDLLDHYASIGVVSMGYSFSKLEPQAKLTEIGKQLVALG
jgi:hypothetical protein